ncbi:glycosyltransferase [Weissella confusa]|uniref:glycosyltransferase n=1 Tax=Weissella confusa TaxID=1583 RepID=UPI0018F274E2|nr:glycosyltransferase [Weissella confusa]MBJ7670821.1 glycosyltransferase [Weissella confusa]
MGTTTISIVTYNNEQEITQRLTELIPVFNNQSVESVIIVDSGSNDETARLASEFADTHEKVTLIALKNNNGFGFGHNVALNRSRSKYHLVMNLDSNPMDSTVVEKMAQDMDLNTEVGLLSPLVVFPNGEVQRLTRKEPTVLDLAIRFLGPNVMKKRQDDFVNLSTGYDTRQRIYNATGSFMFFRKSVLDQIGGFDERFFLYMEDTDVTKSVNQVSEAWFEPNYVVEHEWQRGNHSFKGASLLIVSMLKYFKKWGWKFW